VVIICESDPKFRKGLQPLPSAAEIVDAEIVDDAFSKSFVATPSWTDSVSEISSFCANLCMLEKVWCDRAAVLEIADAARSL